MASQDTRNILNGIGAAATTLVGILVAGCLSPSFDGSLRSIVGAGGLWIPGGMIAGGIVWGVLWACFIRRALEDSPT